MQDWRYVSEILSKRYIISPQFYSIRDVGLEIKDVGLEIRDTGLEKSDAG